jgi:ketosteroid isomerase-like protein
MSEENVEIVKRSIAAYSGRDFEAMRAMAHPDTKLDWSASRGLEAGIYKGVEEVMGFYRNFLDTFEKIDIEPDRFIESGDSVVVPNTAYLRGRDGIETVARSAFVFELRDGLITRICLYQETQEALEAVGLRE